MQATFSDPSSTSPSLLEATIAGDSSATEKIYLIYFPLVHRWCCEFGLDQNDAGDIAQIAVLKAFESISQYSPDRGRFRVWLWSIARNTAYDFFRRAQRESPVDNRKLQAISTPPSTATDRKLPAIIATRALEILTERLSAKQLAIVKASLIADRPAADVADEYGTTVGAVYTAQSRAVKLLRESLQEFEPYL